MIESFGKVPRNFRKSSSPEFCGNVPQMYFRPPPQVHVKNLRRILGVLDTQITTASNQGGRG